MKNGRTMWKKKAIYIDIDTGEQLTAWNAKTNYKNIKTEKNATFENYNKTKGTINWTVLCRHKRQGELPFID